MSIEVLLIPIGVAAYMAIKEGRSADLCQKCRATRIKDQSLLLAALSRMGAQAKVMAEGRVVASSPHGQLTFQRVGDCFLGRVDSAPEAHTVEMLRVLDSNVGLVLQQHHAQLLKQRAESMGFRLLEEKQTDGTLCFVFEEL